MAEQSPDYARWPYRDVVEQRIREAEANVTAFNAAPAPGGKNVTPMMIGSNAACMACHQR
jgi:hypothetical protein